MPPIGVTAAFHRPYRCCRWGQPRRKTDRLRRLICAGGCAGRRRLVIFIIKFHLSIVNIQIEKGPGGVCLKVRRDQGGTKAVFASPLRALVHGGTRPLRALEEAEKHCDRRQEERVQAPFGSFLEREKNFFYPKSVTVSVRQAGRCRLPFERTERPLSRPSGFRGAQGKRSETSGTIEGNREKSANILGKEGESMLQRK